MLAPTHCSAAAAAVVGSQGAWSSCVCSAAAAPAEAGNSPRLASVAASEEPASPGCTPTTRPAVRGKGPVNRRSAEHSSGETVGVGVRVGLPVGDGLGEEEGVSLGLAFVEKVDVEVGVTVGVREGVEERVLESVPEAVGVGEGVGVGDLDREGVEVVLEDS